MATTPQRGATLSEFRANGFDLARERREYEKGSDHERQELRRDEQRAQQILGGGTEDVSAGRRVAFAARAARERYEKNEEKRRKEDLEVMILTMMLDGDFSAYLSDQVVDNMSDAEISAFVDRIEQVTGKSLEDYAAELLGEENAQRKPGESDADYKRRIVKAIHKEVMDVSVDPDGNPVPNIKPKYADDARIRDIFNEGVIQDYRDTVE